MRHAAVQHLALSVMRMAMMPYGITQQIKLRCMNRLYVLLVAVALFSCSKKDVVQPDPVPDPNHPNMQYTDLQNAEVKRGKTQSLDIDGDGTKDFAFGVYLVGDAINKEDKIRFAAFSSLAKNLFVDGNNLSPVLSKGQVIPLNGQSPYEWYEISEVLLIEKIIGMVKPPYWQGPWDNMKNKYFSLQVKKNGMRYNGWIELSFDKQDEKIVLHRAAICKEAEKEVKAGL
jgi:hypothetical protein